MGFVAGGGADFAGAVEVEDGGALAAGAGAGAVDVAGGFAALDGGALAAELGCDDGAEVCAGDFDAAGVVAAEPAGAFSEKTTSIVVETSTASPFTTAG